MRARRLTILAVAAVFLGALGLVAWLIAAHAPDLPYMDDWSDVPELTGDRPMGLRWLWSQHNEHRLPLPRLVHAGLHATFGIDFRMPVVFHVAVLAAAAGLCLRALARRRGRVVAGDAIVPAHLLTAGLAEGTLFGFSTTFVLPSALLVAAVATMLGAGARLGTGRAFAHGAILLALPLCGSAGAAAVPPLAAWLAGAGWRERLGSRRAAAVAIGLSAASVALAVAIVAGIEMRPETAGPRPLAAVLRRASEALATSLGRTGEPTWPGSTLTLAAIALASVVAALAVARADAEARLRASGVAAVVVSIAGIALAIGWGRATEIDRAGFSARYSAVMAPLPVACWAACAVARDDALRRGLSAALVTLVALTAPSNLVHGRDWASERSRYAESLERDVFGGLTLPEIAQRHAKDHLVGDVTQLLSCLGCLEKAHAGPFRLGPSARVERLAEIARRHHRSDSPLRTPPGTFRSAQPPARVPTASGDALALVAPCELRFPIRAGRHELRADVELDASAGGRVRVFLLAPGAEAGPSHLADFDLAAATRLALPFETASPQLLVLRGDAPDGAGAAGARYFFRDLEIRALPAAR